MPETRLVPGTAAASSAPRSASSASEDTGTGCDTACEARQASGGASWQARRRRGVPVRPHQWLVRQSWQWRAPAHGRHDHPDSGAASGTPTCACAGGTMRQPCQHSGRPGPAQAADPPQSTHRRNAPQTDPPGPRSRPVTRPGLRLTTPARRQAPARRQRAHPASRGCPMAHPRRAADGAAARSASRRRSAGGSSREHVQGLPVLHAHRRRARLHRASHTQVRTTKASRHVKRRAEQSRGGAAK